MKKSDLSLDVLKRVAPVYNGKAKSLEQTEEFIDQALKSLLPFTPNIRDKNKINGFLRYRQADKVACMGAWALYRDYHINGRLEDQNG